MTKSTNPQDAMVGDLIMWTSSRGGFSFGKIISFMNGGRPMVRRIREPWFEGKRYLGSDWVPDENGRWGTDKDGNRIKGRWQGRYEEVNIQHPVEYRGGQKSGYNWMVIAYGPNNPQSRTVSEPHPIALAKRLFAELESGIQGAF